MKITKFDMILNLWVSLIISLILSYALPMLATGGVTAGGYISGLIVSFIISMVLVTFVPLVKWGDMFAAKCGAKPFTVPRQLLAAIVLVLIMATVMSSSMTWFFIHNIPGYQSFFLSAWLHAYPWALLVVYISANISLWTGIPLTKKILGIPSGVPEDHQNPVKEADSK